ncbi:lysA [Mytilus coruscus]|uniref:LysA n=1 Tax=Mytilus coruscus TaxID=42192 RepID=A0A6J8BMC0_MYTCO|nr:lysA [Mytilus coruscus]
MEEVFCFRSGVLHVENVSVHSIFPISQEEPVYVFSKQKIISNIMKYKNELNEQSFPSTINYSMKANANPSILQMFKENGCSLTLVSGLELKLALELQFPIGDLVFNGNGKQNWEIDLAIQNEVLLNIDSVFNLQQTIAVCKQANKPARVLLRVNPDINVDVHEHVLTGKIGSKFGVDEAEFNEVVTILQNEQLLTLVGLHCHLGSTIDDVAAIAESTETVSKIFRNLKAKGFGSMKYINIGGGFGIPYRKKELETLGWKNIEESHKNKLENVFNEMSSHSDFQSIIEDFKSNKIAATQFLELTENICKMDNPQIVEKLKKSLGVRGIMPTPADLIQSIKQYIDDDVHLIIEPGRSLVGNAAILLCRALGCKQSGDKHFLVVNGSMNEVIRPSLYGAYHHIELAEPPVKGGKKIYDVVGPVCESGDFLGKNRLLSTPQDGCLLAVFDTGAYCGSMSMTYNMRRRAAEIMVDNDTVKVIRRADTYEDLMKPYRI